MIETKVSTSNKINPLTSETLREMVASPGPCVSVFLPPYRPGEPTHSRAAVLKAHIQETARRFSIKRISDQTARELLEPLQALTQDQELLTGSRWGRALYRSPNVLRQFDLIGPVNEELTVGARFFIRPLLAELHLPAQFYLLELSKKDVALLRCAHFHAEEVELPKGVPTTLEEALEFKKPDHDLENRSAAGSSDGAKRRVRFGTGSGRETQQTYLSDFYRAVDRGVVEVLSNSKAPLVLAGVDEDTAIYRMINTYSNLLARAIGGSALGSFPLREESLEQAYWIVRSDVAETAAARLAEWKERATPARFSVHLEEILKAAMDGRVDSVYIDESAQRMGAFAAPNQHSWGEEDLLNLAATETILRGGQAFALPNSKMPDMAVAAILRY